MSRTPARLRIAVLILLPFLVLALPFLGCAKADDAMGIPNGPDPNPNPDPDSSSSLNSNLYDNRL